MKKENIIIITISIVIVIIFSVFLGKMMIEGYSEQSLEEYCKSIENDRGLHFPCKCFPYTDKEHIDIEIQDKIDNLCICQCQISENRTITIPVARAKD